VACFKSKLALSEDLGLSHGETVSYWSLTSPIA